MRLLIVPDSRNERARDAVASLASWCAARGVEPVIAQADAEACGVPELGISVSAIGEPGLAVALGGDGTIIKAVHLVGDVETPLLGVKFGRLGFLSGASAERMYEAIEVVLAGHARIERRTTLSADVFMDGRCVGTYRALNEIAVLRTAAVRLMSCDVRVGGYTLSSLRADGVVVSTATGSTAYALSAGGPIIAPGFTGMVVVPVAAHRLDVRPVITESDDVVEIELSDPDRSEVTVAVDGTTIPARQPVQRVSIRRGAHDVRLVKLEGRHFYETVAQEFFGGRR